MILEAFGPRTWYTFNLARSYTRADIEVEIISGDFLSSQTHSWDIKGMFQIQPTDDMWDMIDSWLRDLTGRNIRTHCMGLRLLLGNPVPEVAVYRPRTRTNDAWDEKPDSPPSDWERAQDADDAADSA
jgi:hypothetical protein